MQLCSSGGLSRSWGLGVPFRSLPQSCCFVSYQSDGETPQRVSVGGRPRQSSVFGDTDPTNGTGLPHRLRSGLRSPPRSRSRYRSDGCCAVLWLTRHFAAEANQFRDFGLPSTRAKAESGQRAIHKPARVDFELCPTRSSAAVGPTPRTGPKAARPQQLRQLHRLRILSHKVQFAEMHGWKPSSASLGSTGLFSLH
jgi:hypothetical protein